MMEILPQVQHQEWFGKKIAFANEYAFEVADKKVENYLRTFLNCSQDAKQKIIFKTDASLKKEEYVLEVDENIVIVSSCAEGAFRAVSTLKQLVRFKETEKQKIHDYPMIKERGIMIDISRGKVPLKETLFKLVDIMADLKYNQLQLYLENLVFEYDHFAEYCKDMMPITKEELIEIKKYCEDRFIELVPNQNGLGHMGEWLKKEELKPLGITREDGKNSSTLNPLKKESLELVDTIYGDLLPYFDSKFFNVGLDEPIELGMGETKDACEKHGKGKVYLDYLNKIIELSNEKYNKTPMFWDDIVFSHPESIKDINPDCIVLDWGYEEEFPFMERCGFLKKQGLKFYTCPGTSSWGSYTGRFENMVYNIESAAKACIVHKGEGMLLTDWGNGGHPQFTVMSFLSYIYGACCSWNYKVPLALEPFTHTPYSKMNRSILKYVIDYADEFLFDGNKVGAILRKLCNYYILENCSIWDSTVLLDDLSRILNGKETFIEPVSCLQIVDYMQNIKKELIALNKKTPYIEEIICNCHMVILTAKFIECCLNERKDTELKEEILKLKEEFLRLWKKENRVAGSEIFAGKLDKMAEML